jgi:STE24 endopeptidase
MLCGEWMKPSQNFGRRRMRLGFFLLAAGAIWCASVARAQTGSSPAAPSRTTTPAASEQSEAPAPAAQADVDRYTLSHERYEKAIAYARAEYTLYFVSFFYGVLVLVLILRLGIAAKLRDVAQHATENHALQAVIFAPLLILLVDLLDLPLRLYWHMLSLRYEQSVQGWGSWMWDWAKEELLGIGIAAVLVMILFAVIRRSPRRWWLYFWFAALPILLFLLFIMPWYIDPLFHKFRPLQEAQPQLVTAIQKLSDRAGVPIPPQRMFLMEASTKTNQVNAYVTGFGASKRVVIWDTTLSKTTQDEALFIVGHELGHYVLGHVRNGFLFFSAGLLLGLYAGYRALFWMLDRWGKSWKVYGQADLAALAVLLLVLEVLSFAASPIENGFSRMQEHNADVYGLELIHGVMPNSERVAAHAFQVLGEIDLSDPNPSPFITFWLYGHPPLAERLVFAHSYDPWSKGQSPKYVK